LELAVVMVAVAEMKSVHVVAAMMETLFPTMPEAVVTIAAYRRRWQWKW